MAYLFAILLLRVLLRRQWAAVSVLILLLTTVLTLGQPNPLIVAPIALLYWSMQILLLVRFGMLAFLASRLFLLPGIFMILTTDLSSWYAGRTLLFPLVNVVLVAYAFYISLAGRPLVSDRLFEAEATAESRAG